MAVSFPVPFAGEIEMECFEVIESAARFARGACVASVALDSCADTSFPFVAESAVPPDQSGAAFGYVARRQLVLRKVPFEDQIGPAC